jgi:elongation factor G
VPELKAGDLGAVAKLKDTLTNDTLGDKTDAVTFAAIKFPNRCSPTRSSPRPVATKTRSARRCTGSRRGPVDPLQPRSADQSCCSGQGQLHIEVTVAKLKRRFASTSTSNRRAFLPRNHQGVHRAARASQEADRRARSVRRLQDQWTLTRGADFEFVDDIFGGSIPRQYVPPSRRGFKTRGPVDIWPAIRWSISA